MNKLLPIVITLSTSLALTPLSTAQNNGSYSNNAQSAQKIAQPINPSSTETRTWEMNRSPTQVNANNANLYPSLAVGKLTVIDNEDNTHQFTCSFFGAGNIILCAGHALMDVGAGNSSDPDINGYEIVEFVQAPGTNFSRTINGNNIEIAYLNREKLVEPGFTTETFANYVTWNFAFLRTSVNSNGNHYLGWRPDIDVADSNVRLVGYSTSRGGNSNRMYFQSAQTVIPENPFLEEPYSEHNEYNLHTDDRIHIVIPEGTPLMDTTPAVDEDNQIVKMLSTGAPWLVTTPTGNGNELVSGYIATFNMFPYSSEPYEFSDGPGASAQEAINAVNPDHQGTYLFTPFFDMTVFEPDMFWCAFREATQNPDAACSF